jgi:RNA polymerase subunit RPABC4/transcription elongation factor Spt4
MPPPFCPSCGSPDLTTDSFGSFHCHACGESFRVNAPHCAGCGAVLAPADETCPNCGTPADLAEQVFGQRAGAASPLWLDRTRSQAGALKSSGEENSQVRMQSLREVDRRREEETARLMAARRASDRRLMIVLAAAVSIFLVVVVAAVFLASMR